jgi:WD40 repeat protein
MLTHRPFSLSLIARRLVILLCAVFIGGCSSSDDDTPIPTRVPPIDLGIPPTVVLPDTPPTPLPPTWTPKPTLTPVIIATVERTKRPTETPFIIPTRTRPPEVEAQVRQLSDLPVISARNAARLREIVQIEQSVRDLAFSPDGTLLVLASNYEGVFVYDMAALDYPLRRMGTTWNWPRSLSYHPRQAQVAVAYDDGMARIWNPETGGVVRVIDAPGQEAWSVAFNADGTLLAVGGESGRISLWDAENGTLLCELNTSGSQVERLVFQPGGDLLLSGGFEDYVWVWNTTACTQQAVLDSGGGGVKALIFSPDGQIIASGGDYQMSVSLWDSRLLDDPEPVDGLEGDISYVSALAYSPDGSLIAALSSDDELVVWDTTTREPVAQINTRLSWAEVLRFSPDGRLLVLGGAFSDTVLYGVTAGG